MISDTEKFAVPKRGEYNFKHIPLKDHRVWAAFGRGETVGVFQLEKQLGQDWSRRLKPQNIEHLAALTAILRPACLESKMADDYCDRKNGDKKVEYFHSALEAIFKTTYGCNVYQEQSIQIGREIAGMTEEEADTYIRKGIGKKLADVIAECKKRFLEGAKKVGKVTEAEAQEIFSWLEKAQRYQFNKSHSVEYAITAYQTMYAKVHYPTEFYCAWLTYADWKPDPKEEIYNLVQDAKRRGIQVMPPEIYRGNVDFEIVKDKVISFGISDVKGVGEKSVLNIQKYKDQLKDFNGFLLVANKLKRNVCEGLIKSGACDSYGIDRTQMLRQLWCVLGRSDNNEEQQINEVKKLTPNELSFVLENLPNKPLKQCLTELVDSKKCTTKRKDVVRSKVAWLDREIKDNNKQKAIWEKIYLGLNLSCSAADDVQKNESSDSCSSFFLAKPKDKMTLYCVIDKIHYKKTGEKSKIPGREYCYLSVSDNTGAIACVVVWPDLFEQISQYLFENTVVKIDGRKDGWGGREQLICQNLEIIG